MQKEEARIQLRMFFENSIRDFDLSEKTNAELKIIFRAAIQRRLTQTKQTFSQMSNKTIHEAEADVKKYQWNKGMLEAMLEVYEEEYHKFICDMKQKAKQDKNQLTEINKGLELGG